MGNGGARQDRVRMWRPDPAAGILLMAGQSTHYAVDPRGEYVFGVVAGNPMRSVRGRERRLVMPGQLVAWDPSAAHSGTAVDGKAWTSRLMVVEVGDLTARVNDQESQLLADVRLPQSVITDPALAGTFVRLHAALALPITRLERDARLAEWLRSLLSVAGAVRSPRPPLTAGDDKALLIASDYLRDRFAHNIGLDELATAAGIGKFRLIRLFRERTGLPPHALQIAYRIRKARRYLEAGDTIADAAAATGFADQSHLHRHFHRSLGITPRDYQQQIRGAALPGR